LPSHGSESGSPEMTRNTLMIEPPKATKGRRMSKKSRKKSPKTSPRRKAAAKSSKASKTSIKKTRPAAVNTSNKKRSSEPSHKAASKRLKSSSSAATGKPPNGGSAVEKSHALTEGAKAPPFHLPRDGGGMIALSDYAGKKLVLFFYPRADTPGCTREAIDFTRLKGAFAESGAEVLGISADSLGAQERFRDKHKLAVPLISDEKHQMLEAYGAWGEKSMYGRTFLGIVRTTVLIGADVRVARIWRHVKVDGHADAVLAAALAL
jgi:peroxiredoxin Q/BCP